MSKSMAKPKAKDTSRASKSRTSAAKSKRRPKARAKATVPPKPGAKSKRDATAGVKGNLGAEAKHAAGKARSRLIDERIRSLGDWRADTLAEVRRLIHEADPNTIEDCKWIKPTNPLGVPVWSHAGIVCTGEAYKQVVKLTFARGASLPDPRRLFNSSLEGNMRRAIDIREGEVVDAKAFKALIQAAVGENLRSGTAKSPGTKPQAAAKAGAKTEPDTKEAKPVKAPRGAKVVLLSGGNPQIAKADGDAPVQVYIAGMPGWKRNLGRRLDALIVRSVPNVRKAVKWNSPFYGIEGQGWFLSFHVFTHYVKVTFFRGTSLRPVPPGGTGKDARWIDLRENDELDEVQMAKWVNQAAALPGWAT
jgi:hypothetical protein